MSGVAKKDFVGMYADPFRTQPPRDVASYGRGKHSDNNQSSHSQCLFSFERVFDAADGVLNLALYFVGLALRLQLGVTDRLADRLLHCAFDLLRRSNEPVLVHYSVLQ